MPVPEPPAGPTPAETQQMRITTAATASQTAILAVDNDSTDEEVTTAETALQALKAAIDGATAHLTDAQKAARMQTYNVHVVLLKERTDARTAHKTAQDDMMKAAANKARNDAAMKWVAAINTYKVATAAANGDNAANTNAAVSGNLSADLPKTSDLKVEHKNGSTQITLDDSRGLPITPMDSMAPATGWTAKSFTETPDKSRGVIITNRGPAVTRTQRHGYANYFTIADTTTPLTGVTIDANGVLTFAANTARFRDIHFGGSRPAGFRGTGGRPTTFLGASGRLACAAACTIVTNDDGTFSFSSEATFSPSLPASGELNDIILTITTVTPDTDYVQFGYWLTTTGSGNNMRHMIDTYAEAIGYGALDASPADLRGSATYSGGAAGVYVLKTGSSLSDLHNGEFVADVALKAQFGDNSNMVAGADRWKITGNINGFRPTKGTHDLSGWDLKLSADFGPRTADTNTVEAPVWLLDNAVTKGGGADGSWQASFHGNAGSSTTTGDAPTADNYPKAIVGEFNGHFLNGHVVGAFGAEKD